MTVIIAPICGPILGGYICDNFSWGWIFLINVPMGIIVLTLCLTLLKGRETETSPVKMNLPGLTLLVLGVGGLQIMLDKGRDLDWFNFEYNNNTNSSVSYFSDFFSHLGVDLREPDS